MYKLIKTNQFKVGKLEVTENSYLVDSEIHRHSVKLLFNATTMKPVFEVNAYITSESRVKDCTAQQSKALLKYFNFLSVNPSLSWNGFSECTSEHYPTILFRNTLKRHNKKGLIADTTANAYMNIIKNFYLFCYRHGYIEREYGLPFTLESSMYGKSTSNLRIKVYGGRNKNLKPINQYHLSLIIKHWNNVAIEIRLAILITLFTGLRNKEVTSISKKILTYPVGYEGTNVTGITVSPRLGVNTKLGIERKISCPSWLINLLGRYHNSERYRKRTKLYYEQNSDFNFPALIDKNGNAYTSREISQQWTRLSMHIRNESDINYKHKFYDLRATFGVAKVESLIAATKLNELQIRALLSGEMGHTDPTTTDLYLEHWQMKPEQVQFTSMMEGLVEEALLSGVIEL